MREAQVMAQYAGMVAKRAKNTTETKTLMVELEEKARKVEEVTGQITDSKHAMSVIVIDTETLKHTAQCQGATADVDVLKRKIIEFVNI